MNFDDMFLSNSTQNILVQDTNASPTRNTDRVQFNLVQVQTVVCQKSFSLSDSRVLLSPALRTILHCKISGQIGLKDKRVVSIKAYMQHSKQ